MARPTLIVEGLKLPESPRWYQGQLWFVDMFAHTVLRRRGGRIALVAAFQDETSGLGFLPDGSLMVVLKFSQQVVRIGRDGSTHLHADLRWLNANHLNDMIVDASGRAYVDVNSYIPGEDNPTRVRDRIALVEPDGRTRIVADDLLGPNGLALSQDGSTLVIAESRAARIVAMDVSKSDGSLGGKRVIVDTEPRSPDGLCLDADGGTWYGAPLSHEFIRVAANGAVTNVVPLPVNRLALACVLGGSDRRSLFLCSADVDPKTRFSRGGWIESLRVPIMGAGQP